ncbi:MAG TPA: pyridoxal phosphate-dependent aminotransferase [Syntrophales bacterium]|nr:pyridoxal phosphate-dependent aminotransferase [Syntrophales bacterium]
MAIGEKIRGFISQSSMIRKMFEEGLELKKRFGEENVYDFSLGNPDLPPPAEFQEELVRVVREEIPGKHSYMPNAGYPETRQAVALYLSEVHGMEIPWENVVMTCGAGGALNVIFKTILDAGDEVIVPTPCFVEYGFYVDNAGGDVRYVSSDDTFSLNLSSIRQAISRRTKAVLINSPHNPTGRVYNEETIFGLGELLKEESRKIGRTIYLVSDEPYRDIVYDGVQVPSVFAAYENSLIATSYSKSLSLAGERIGFIAVQPHSEGLNDLMGGLILCNRMLGFVNAPALMQRVIARLPHARVNVKIYEKRRNELYRILKEAGYDCVLPEGAFYLFPRSPIADDRAFVQILKKYRILAVPGSGFLGPGYFRLAYCVREATIEGSRAGFKAAMEEALQ